MLLLAYLEKMHLKRLKKGPGSPRIEDNLIFASYYGLSSKWGLSISVRKSPPQIKSSSLAILPRGSKYLSSQTAFPAREIQTSIALLGKILWTLNFSLPSL